VSSSAQGFRIEEILGAGSTSTVVLARRGEGDHRFVIKVLQPELLEHQEILARTRDEARLLEMLQHPNIVRVEALAVHHGHPLVLMEYVDGVDLGTLLRAGMQPVPAPEAVEIVRCTALALDTANTAPLGPDGARLHVVHRDVKPSNLLLGLDGSVKVVDFGLARAEFEDREARTDAFVLGSMGFVAPERYSLLQPTAAIDVYALGITFAELLSARTLLLPRARDRHDAELARQLARIAPPELPDAARIELHGVISRMCGFEPVDRPSAGDVAAELGAWLARYELKPDLVALAAARIPEIRAKRKSRPPAEHPAWANVAFLEEAEPEGRRPIERLLALFKWRGT
jgi:eukaryotic-like serine/threonine-protein kinase